MSLKEIGNGVVLGNRIGMSVLVGGALGWAMLDDWIKVPNGEECGQKQKEMEKAILKGPFIPFVSLFAARV
jgi:uncharacterized oligopeptide transporter (OPT) family protein